MNRVHQTVLIASTIGLSWLGMMIVHEAGHVTGAWMTGGAVSRVVLHPLAFSLTELSHNPNPLYVVWCGPVIGALAPLAALGIATIIKARGAYLLRFFAGFCLVANGVYLGIGVFERIGDAGDLIALGSARWQLWVFGAVTVPVGLVLWHGLGPKFGLGAGKGRVSGLSAYVVTGLFVGVVVVELIFSTT